MPSKHGLSDSSAECSFTNSCIIDSELNRKCCSLYSERDCKRSSPDSSSFDEEYNRISSENEDRHNFSDGECDSGRKHLKACACVLTQEAASRPTSVKPQALVLQLNKQP